MKLMAGSVVGGAQGACSRDTPVSCKRPPPGELKQNYPNRQSGDHDPVHVTADLLPTVIGQGSLKIYNVLRTPAVPIFRHGEDLAISS